MGVALEVMMTGKRENVNPYSEKFENLGLDLVLQEQEPEALVCPVCSGPLYFSMHLQKRRESVSILFQCEDCGVWSALLGVSPVPKWMRHKD